MEKALKVLGIIYLAAAVILAIMILFNYGFIEVDGYYSSRTVINYTAIGLSAGIIFQGGLIFSLALGLAQVIEKCDEITYKLDTVRSNTEKKKYLKCRSCGALNEDTGYNRRCKECDGILTNADVVEM